MQNTSLSNSLRAEILQNTGKYIQIFVPGEEKIFRLVVEIVLIL